MSTNFELCLSNCSAVRNIELSLGHDELISFSYLLVNFPVLKPEHFRIIELLTMAAKTLGPFVAIHQNSWYYIEKNVQDWMSDYVQQLFLGQRTSRSI